LKFLSNQNYRGWWGKLGTTCAQSNKIKNSTKQIHKSGYFVEGDCNRFKETPQGALLGVDENGQIVAKPRALTENKCGTYFFINNLYDKAYHLFITMDDII
jgi:hypothetical protein